LLVQIVIPQWAAVTAAVAPGTVVVLPCPAAESALKAG
jgi:hypothetical protein